MNARLGEAVLLHSIQLSTALLLITTWTYCILLLLLLLLHQYHCSLPTLHTSSLFINGAKPLSLSSPLLCSWSLERAGEGMEGDMVVGVEEIKPPAPLPCCSLTRRSSSPRREQACDRVHTHRHTHTYTQTLRCTRSLAHFLSLTHTRTHGRGRLPQTDTHCRLPLAWETLMCSSLQAKALAAISKALCWGGFTPGWLGSAAYAGA